MSRVDTHTNTVKFLLLSCLPSHLAVSCPSSPSSDVFGVGPQRHWFSSCAEVRAHRTENDEQQCTGGLLHTKGGLFTHTCVKRILVASLHMFIMQKYRFLNIAVVDSVLGNIALLP